MSQPAIAQWTQQKGMLKYICTGPGKNVVYGVNDGNLYLLNLSNSTGWDVVATPPGEHVDQVSVGSDGVVWICCGSCKIYSKSPGGTWGFVKSFTVPMVPVPGLQGVYQPSGAVPTVAVGDSSHVWCTDPLGTVYTLRPANGNGLGNLTQISVAMVAGQPSVWGVSGAGEIYHWNFTGSSWTKIAGSLSQVSVGADGSVWGLDHKGNIWYSDKGTGAWTQLNGNLSMISVGVSGAVWGLSSQGYVYSWNN